MIFPLIVLVHNPPKFLAPFIMWKTNTLGKEGLPLVFDSYEMKVSHPPQHWNQGPGRLKISAQISTFPRLPLQ